MLLFSLLGEGARSELHEGVTHGFDRLGRAGELEEDVSLLARKDRGEHGVVRLGRFVAREGAPHGLEVGAFGGKEGDFLAAHLFFLGLGFGSAFELADPTINEPPPTPGLRREGSRGVEKGNY